jgi:hypothetical protein
MAIRTLYIPLSKNEKPANDAAIRAKMEVLARDLGDFTCRMAKQGGGKGEAAEPGCCGDTRSLGGSCFNAKNFAAHLKELQELLPS